MVSVGVKSAVTAYVPALVGAVEEALYLMLETEPATDEDTVAVCGAALYMTGELVTFNVGVALEITKLPAEAAVKEL